MSSTVIRDWVRARLPEVYFVPGQYSSDNAIGVSILAAKEAGLWLK
jgi:N6-L-threonylcarbamoyladenine synthase